MFVLAVLLAVCVVHGDAAAAAAAVFNTTTPADLPIDTAKLGILLGATFEVRPARRCASSLASPPPSDHRRRVRTQSQLLWLP